MKGFQKTKSKMPIKQSLRMSRMEYHGVTLQFSLLYRDTVSGTSVLRAIIYKYQIAFVEDELGNAYFTAYTETGFWDLKKLLLSVKAYTNALKDRRLKRNGFLYYNSALVHKFIENYMVALCRFEVAGLMNPFVSDSCKQAQNLYKILDGISSVFKVPDNATRFSPPSSFPTVDSLESAIASIDLNRSCEIATVDSLINGSNEGKAIIGKVLFSIANPGKIPLYYVVCGSDQTCFLVTIYGVHSDAIKDDDEVMLLDPFYHFFDFELKGKHFQFKSVRVLHLKRLLVNGAILSRDHVVHESFYAQTD